MKTGFVVIFYREKTENSINEQVNESKESLLLELLKHEPSSTYSGLAKKMNVSYATIRRMIQKLTEKNKIKRFGSDKKGGWTVLDK